MPAFKRKLTAEEEEAEAKKARRPVRVELRKVDAAGRRDDARRGGKINVVDALNDATERMRSLASVRRAREKERLKQLQMQSQPAVARASWASGRCS